MSVTCTGMCIEFCTLLGIYRSVHNMHMCTDIHTCIIYTIQMGLKLDQSRLLLSFHTKYYNIPLSYLCFLISCKLTKQIIKKKIDKAARAIWSYQIQSMVVSKPRVLSESVPLIHSGGKLQDRRRERGRERAGSTEHNVT